MTAQTAIPAAAPLRVAGVIAADIKLHHSVFALPFAVLAAFMAAMTPAGGPVAWTRFGPQLALVVAAMVLARTFAMLANRLLDREIDRFNPRTAGRALPSGRLGVAAATTTLAACAAGFLAVCTAFGLLDGNWWPAVLGGPVLGWLAVYPLLKRVTSWCHLWLGASLAMSPLAAAVAVTPRAVLEQPALWLLAVMVLCWVAGFDVIYALQDVEVDRRFGHFSLPSRWGRRRAMWASRALHLAAVATLAGAAAADTRLGVPFGLGVLVVAGVLVAEHLTVARWGTTRMALAFFTLNGVVSCVLGAVGTVDLLIS